MIETPIWNETVANLTLMALGSSAPEILLSVIQTVSDLKAVPPELGASTIVGSAAFNLLCISAVSILAVDDQPKKVKDTGTFAVTSIASIFAYIWLYLALSSMTPGFVTVAEGWLTLVFFFLLIIFSYWADKVNQYIEENKQTAEEIEEKNKQDEKKIKKN
jgi:solute carrier family 8 (sodium/calcium exchanger)